MILNKNTIESSIALALRCGWSWTKLGHELTGPPYNLTPPDATIVMDEYRRRYPNAAAQRQNLPRRERKIVAKAVKQIPEGGELLAVPTAGRPSIINRSAVKAFALKASKEKRAGKFNRVSKEFLDSVEANLEALIREIAQEYSKQDKHKHGVDPDPESDWFINGRTLRCVEEKLNDAVKMIILAKVHAHPTVGKTLK